MTRAHIKRLHWLTGEAGPTAIQLVSAIMQYDDLAEQSMQQIMGLGITDGAGHAEKLDGHIRFIGQVLKQAQRQVGPIHDNPLPWRIRLKGMGAGFRPY